MFSKAWLIAFVLPVLVQGIFAYRDKFLLPEQVIQYEVQGLPFVAHGGMWADIFIFAPLMAYIIGVHGAEWSIKFVSIALIFGFVASAAMHYKVYIPCGLILPEAHTHDGELTTAGVIHLYYMTAGLAVIALFFTCSPGVTAAEAATVSSLLFVHCVIGTHVPFKMWVNATRPIWYPAGPAVDVPGIITLAGVAVTLIGLSIWATR